VLSNVGDGGAMADIGGGFWACRNGILVDIAGLSAIIRYVGAKKRPVWRDFGSPPWTAIDNNDVIIM